MSGINLITAPNISLPNLNLSNNTSQTSANGTSFSQMLNNALNNVNAMQQTADQAGVQLAAGNTTDIHNVMIATEQASLAMDLAVQVRNKVVEAYQQMMQMQI